MRELIIKFQPDSSAEIDCGSALKRRSGLVQGNNHEYHTGKRATVALQEAI